MLQFPSEAPRWLQKAQEAQKERNFELAINNYSIAISQDNTKPAWQLQRGKLYLLLENYHAALQDAQTVITRSPKEAKNWAYILLGEALLAMRQTQAAKGAFARAIQLAPECQSYIENKVKLAPEGAPLTIYRLGPQEKVAQIITKDLMIASWRANQWWYKPTNFNNANPNYPAQMAKLTAFTSKIDELAKTGFQELSKEYQQMNFDPSINILRGPSIMVHPVMHQFKNKILGLCELAQFVPDILLWAPDIPVHLLVALWSSIPGRETHKELGFTVTLDNITVQQERKYQKTLLKRAWKEAIRIEEMHPLVFILFPALHPRISSKLKNIDHSITFMQEFVDTCVKMGATTSSDFVCVAHQLAELLESKGRRAEAKAAYLLAINSHVQLTNDWEKESYAQRIPVLHNNIALMYKQDKEYDKAFFHYSKAIEVSVKFDKLLFWQLQKLFIAEDWKPREWRLTTAKNYVKRFLETHKDSKQVIKIMLSQVLTADGLWVEVFRELGYVPAGFHAEETLISSKGFSASHTAKQIVAEAKTFHSQCSFCNEIKPVKFCSRCGKMQYCSPECQKKDWPAHKKLCVPKPK